GASPFVWLQRDGAIISSMAVPLATPILDASAIAYTRDGHQYFRYDRTAGGRRWVHCSVQTEMIEEHPPKAFRFGRVEATQTAPGPLTISARMGRYAELRIPCEAGCVAKNGWAAVPQLLGCDLDN